jgi:hypothetical protein
VTVCTRLDIANKILTVKWKKYRDFEVKRILYITYLYSVGVAACVHNFFF